LICNFVASREAWSIAEQLLVSDNMQLQFIGAQALYRKLDTDIEELGKKDKEVLAFKDSLLGLLASERIRHNKLALDRLSMCAATLALNTCNGAWPSAFSDLIQFGNAGVTECYISLVVFKHCGSIFEHKVFQRMHA